MAAELRRHPRELPYAARWLHSLLPGHSPLDDELPWITFRAIDWLDAYLQAEMSVFEYGAGGSTLYFAKRVREVVSVEHDEEFHKLVQQRFAERGAHNCRLLLEPSRPCQGGDCEYASFQPKYAGLCFESYVRAIDAYPDRHFDLVLVDGRARMACVRQALPKIKPGGALLLDNSERPGYAKAARLLEGMERKDLPGLTPWNMTVSQTSVWRIAQCCNLDRAT